MTTTFYDTMPSPVGGLLLTASPAGITGVYLPGEHRQSQPSWKHHPARLATCRRQLDEYFAGDRVTFSLPLAPPGTPFQQQVWKQLTEIGYGTTISYTELARRVGRPRSQRAVGGANGRNPVCIIVPCHRVVGANGALTGYSAGVESKRWLLDFERATAPRAESDTASGQPHERARVGQHLA
jgi:methylated-DNA-[protein]-cysteine S-methyltransferase